MTAAVLIPSWRRPDRLANCLRALAAQTRRPDRVAVVWQADDTPTRDRAEELRAELPFRLDVLHSLEAGVVPAENLALAATDEDILFLIDDDAEAPPGWIERHLGHFADPTVGAVGGPAVNHRPDGTPFPIHAAEPVGVVRWFGKPVGNMYDHPPEWAGRSPVEVRHLVGYNLALRRTAFGRFEAGLRQYWQLFELDACLQVRRRGFRVLFDFGNVVAHHPTNTAYTGGRDGDLTVKVYHAAFNLAFVTAKHSPAWLLPLRLAFQFGVGSPNVPGVIGAAVAVRRFGRPWRELGVLFRTWKAVAAGTVAGLLRRRKA